MKKKKIFTAGFFSFLAGFIFTAVSVSVSSVGAGSTYVDPSADIFRILFWFGGSFLILGIIMITSASITMKR
jgi:hypothetical protein